MEICSKKYFINFIIIFFLTTSINAEISFKNLEKKTVSYLDFFLLKYENQLLNENVKKFRRSKRILSDHDYTAKLSIEPIEVLEVDGVPESGLLGYTKSEFIANAFDFVNTNMFPPKYMERVSIEFKERVELAKELGLENFDISLNVQFISKDGQSIWAYYVSYYNLKNNVVELYIKFLDDFKSFDTSVKN